MESFPSILPIFCSEGWILWTPLMIQIVHEFGKFALTLRIKFFLWLCFHKSLPTCVLGYRGITLDQGCLLSNSPMESIVHVLRDCPVARNFRKNLGILGSTLVFFTSPLGRWFEMNCYSPLLASKHRIPWKICFPFTAWQLQLHRNQFIFDKGVIDHKFLFSCIGKGTEFVALVSNLLTKPSRTSIPIKWRRPKVGWVKLNKDIVTSSSLGCAEGGGLLRNSERNWLGGFARSLGKCSSLMVELWAFKDGNDGKQGGFSLKDPLQVADGPITRSRAKKIKEAMQELVQSTWDEVSKSPTIKVGLKEGELILIHLIQAVEDMT